jgi:hypothetical protein
MLEEAVDEAIHGGGAGLEQACIGSAILESNLRSLQAAVIGELYQAAIADGDTVDVMSQVPQGRLSITDRLAEGLLGSGRPNLGARPLEVPEQRRETF